VVTRLDAAPLRRCVLAVSVLGDIDTEPAEHGVRLPGDRPVTVGWEAIGLAVGGFDPDGSIARRRVADLFRLYRLLRGPDGGAAARFRTAARLIALPEGHAEHPGPGWAVQTLRGEALQLGIGVHGLLGEPDRSTALPPSVLHALGDPGAEWWPRIVEHAERMGALAAARLGRDGVSGVIRPVGGCDVPALLSSRALRRHLALADGSGLRALAVPTRRRGWFDLTRIDPAFVRAAWSLTDEFDRGLAVPLLITEDEVACPAVLA
jgi:hypothetical protein